LVQQQQQQQQQRLTACIVWGIISTCHAVIRSRTGWYSLGTAGVNSVSSRGTNSARHVAQ
jgi:hypothetical protein